MVKKLQILSYSLIKTDNLQNHYNTSKQLGIEVFSCSTDTHYTHNAWHDMSRKINKIDLDLSQYLGHILVGTVTKFFLLPILQIPVGLDSESSYGFDFGYKILQCS